jgi:protein TonB
MRTHAPAFLLSTLIHLGLLVFVFIGVSLLPLKGPPEEALAISLRMFQPPPPAPVVQAPEAPPPEPVVEIPPEPVQASPPPPRPKPVPKPQPKRVVKPVPPAPPPQVKPEPKPVEPAPAKPVIQAPAPPPVEQQQKVPPAPHAPADESLLRRLEEAYMRTLRKAIEARKGYPRRARRLHQEGDVTVGFSVRRDGSITDLHVVESSGHSLLDRAALEAVRQVDGSLPFPQEIERSVWAFTLPIGYALR